MYLIIKYLKKRADSFTPYVATFYYVEILYFMIFINFLYGKVYAVITGISLSIILTSHVLRLFYKKDFNRKLQLFIMDFHFAYSSVFIINRLLSGWTLSSIDYTIVYFRLFTACIEIFMIITLTDKTIKNNYSE